MNSSLSLIDLHLPEISQRVSVVGGEGFYFDDVWFNLKDSLPFGDVKLELSKSIQHLIDELAKRLYLRLFCGLDQSHNDSTLPLLKERQEFMDRLSQANHAAKTPDRDWQMVDTDDFGLSYAEKNGIRRPMLPGTFTLQKEQPNWVDFIRTGEDRERDPNAYHALSNAYFHSNFPQICFYWNVTHDGVFPLLEAISSSLNFYKIPYRFKCPNHPELYNRYDSAMLFVNRQSQNLVNRLLATVNDQIAGALSEHIPLFTTRLAKGLSMSEVPVSELSYGKYMMQQVAERLVAEAIWGKESQSETLSVGTREKMRKGKGLILS